MLKRNPTHLKDILSQSYNATRKESYAPRKLFYIYKVKKLISWKLYNYKNSFLVRTAIQWNHLNNAVDLCVLRQTRVSNQPFIRATYCTTCSLSPGVLMPNRPYTVQKEKTYLVEYDCVLYTKLMSKILSFWLCWCFMPQSTIFQSSRDVFLSWTRGQRIKCLAQGHNTGESRTWILTQYHWALATALHQILP